MLRMDERNGESRYRLWKGGNRQERIAGRERRRSEGARERANNRGGEKSKAREDTDRRPARPASALSPGGCFLPGATFHSLAKPQPGRCRSRSKRRPRGV